MKALRPSASESNKKIAHNIRKSMINVIPTPINIRACYIEKCSFSANSEWNEEENDRDLIKYEVTSQLLKSKSKKYSDDYIIRLFVKTKKQEKTPYSLDIEIVGLFDVADHVPTEQHQDVVNISGTAMLYTAARDFILTITGRGLFAPLLLPTRSFVPAREETIKEKKSRKRIVKDK